MSKAIMVVIKVVIKGVTKTVKILLLPYLLQARIQEHEAVVVATEHLVEASKVERILVRHA